MSTFVGRAEQLSTLDTLLARVAADQGPKPGQALLVRGRRRVGKSRLVEEFLERSGVPHVYFTASTRTTREELSLFTQAVAESSLPGASTFADVTPGSWEAALRLLAKTVPADVSSVVVIDELPYLMASDPGFEGTLQKIFDRDVSRRRLLLIGIGSDLAMMEALNEYGRPFHQRATEMVVPALSPFEVGEMLGLDPPDAFDAYLITGGLPLICQEWRAGLLLWEYVEEALSHSTSALVVSGERALAAEFRAETQARTVLTTIGAGERTFTNIGREAGGLQQASLSRALTSLTDKRVVAVDRPLSTKPSRETRYRVADPYLRFWLTFIGPHLPEIERGRGDRVVDRMKIGWFAWRGRAIEPVIRDAISRLPPESLPFEVGAVGGYWTRTNDPEIDLVLSDREPVARRITAVGSIKWRENQPFDDSDLARLITHRSRLPGAAADAPLLVVSRAGCSINGVVALSPDDLARAWNR